MCIYRTRENFIFWFNEFYVTETEYFFRFLEDTRCLRWFCSDVYAIISRRVKCVIVRIFCNNFVWKLLVVSNKKPSSTEN